jgi:phage tail-like protein
MSGKEVVTFRLDMGAPIGLLSRGVARLRVKGRMPVKRGTGGRPSLGPDDTATHAIRVERVADATRLRGLYPWPSRRSAYDRRTMAEDALLRINCFEVAIGDRELGFAEVGPLTSGTELAEDGEVVAAFSPVVLRRALTTSTELYDWRRNVVAGKDDRRDVTIRQLSAPGGRVVNTWRLVRSWPVRWSGPTFDAMRAAIAFEELELAFDDLVWVTRRGARKGG